MFPGIIRHVSAQHPKSRMQVSVLSTLDLGFKKKPIKRYDTEVVGTECFILALSTRCGLGQEGPGGNLIKANLIIHFAPTRVYLFTDFCCGPLAKTSCSQRMGPQSDPRSGN